MKSGFRLHRIELRNWGTFDGNEHVVVNIDGGDCCFTGLNGSGKSTVLDAILTVLVPHEFRFYNVAANEVSAKRERSLKTYILGAYGSEESSESASGKLKFLRKPGIPTVILAVFRDQLMGRAYTLAQIHWITPSGDHQGRYLAKEADLGIGELGLANLGVAAYSNHFTEKNGWFYSTTFPPYQGKFQSVLRIPSDQALRLFCRSISMKDVHMVTDFIRELMLEPHDTVSYLNGIVKHFQDLDSIHRDLLDTKAQIEWLLPVEKQYNDFKTAADEIDRLANVERAAGVLLVRDAGIVLDGEVDRIDRLFQAHQAEIDRLATVAGGIEQRIIGINVSLRSNSTYTAIENLKNEEDRLGKELAEARSRLKDLRDWLVALQYREPIKTEAHFARLQGVVRGLETSYATRQSNLLEQKGAARAKIGELREKATQLASDIGEMTNKRTKIPREFRAMREDICRDLKINEGLLPFVGELIDVPPLESTWRQTIEVLLNSFALSIVVPEGDMHRQVTGYIEHSRFRRRIVYYAAPQGSGFNVSWSSDYVHAKLTLREDAWCRSWLMQKLLADFNHRCCNTEEEFKATKGRAVTRNKHVRSGDRSLRESDTRDWSDFNILGWSNEAKIRDMENELTRMRADIDSKEKGANQMQREADGMGGSLTVIRKVLQIPSFRAIDEETICTEITIASDRRRELEEKDDEVRALTASLKEAQTELDGVRAQRDDELDKKGQKKTLLERLVERRAAYGKKFNALTEDFDWHAWEAAALEFRGEKPLIPVGLESQIDAVHDKIRAASALQVKVRDKALELLGPKMQEFLTATKDKGYASEWTATAASAPAMIELLRKLRDERYHQLEGDFKHQMHLVLEEDIDFAKTELKTKHNDNEARINLLNQTLRTVVFDDSRNTFVEIVARPSAEPAVVIFRDLLTECTRQVIAMTDEQRMERFKAIRELIDHVNKHRADAERGANPNNWDTFSLSEKKFDDPTKEVNFYAGSTGKSGGQKAKLACTIVAVAMAFRMNHTRRQDSNAFRLIMIDEIFAKSDDVNSAFALRIFDQFDFQLLLVTPRDGRLKLVIPYVESFHLFQNPTESSSMVSSITAAKAEEIATT